jgi:hypothetical protein
MIPETRTRPEPAGAAGIKFARGTVIAHGEVSKRQFVGLFVSFDLRRSNGAVTREKGEVIEQRWLGLTERGLIPEYEVTIRGSSGKSVLARVTEDCVRVLE